jgi:predicted nucleic acid-binding Zn ribbon protein
MTTPLPRLRRRRLMVSEAIGRVLNDSRRRHEIGSLADLKRAYEEELVAHGEEIAVTADRLFAVDRETLQRIITDGLRKHRPCAECGGPIEDAKRFSRRFCSNRCRQRAHRKRWGATPP